MTPKKPDARGFSQKDLEALEAQVMKHPEFGIACGEGRNSDIRIVSIQSLIARLRSAEKVLDTRHDCHISSATTCRGCMDVKEWIRSKGEDEGHG